ncbi:MAG: DNA mismatch repair protein [Flavobacteriales bacterium]|nr:DNA mismatch repair protein [Flavobacteriales bacterium]
MSSILTYYESKKTTHQEKYTELNSKFNLLGTLRLIVFGCLCVSTYLFFQNYFFIYIAIGGVVFTLFLYLLYQLEKLSRKKKIQSALIKINEDEINFIQSKIMPWDDGSEFISPSNPYTYDLDFFGPHSLFQAINRTTLHTGKQTLASHISSPLEGDKILENQKAISELAEQIEFRQEIQALGKITNDSENSYHFLKNWIDSEESNLPSWLTIYSYLAPAILVMFGVIYFITGNATFSSFMGYLFIANILVSTLIMKPIKKQMNTSGKVGALLKGYSVIIKAIESRKFESAKLQRMILTFNNDDIYASTHVKKLASLFTQLDSILNLLISILTNGIALYHVHVYKSLLKWKLQHSENINSWLLALGEFEAFNSLAGFAYNNPDFSYPEINNKNKLQFKDLGHPLIQKSSRIVNDIDFSKEHFILLTGSNMSGKSTFLRSLGINVILAGIGAPICATEATVPPIKVWVSMRLSDSLEDNESYFYAEVKRLKSIIENAEKENTFVLLDEIFKGTNSDDKRMGTVEVIKKLISKNVIGAIATHDLEVCDTTKEYPEKLINKCFEVEIINDDLHFDYKLRNGVCKNKSATFLMKKMNVI